MLKNINHVRVILLCIFFSKNSAMQIKEESKNSLQNNRTQKRRFDCISKAGNQNNDQNNNGSDLKKQKNIRLGQNCQDCGILDMPNEILSMIIKSLVGLHTDKINDIFDLTGTNVSALKNDMLNLPLTCKLFSLFLDEAKALALSQLEDKFNELKNGVICQWGYLSKNELNSYLTNILNKYVNDDITENELKEAIKAIIAGADIDVKNGYGDTVFLISASKGYDDLVELLIRLRVNVNETDNQGRTALMLAAINGHVDAVQLLLANNADVNMTDIWNKTALMFASYNYYKKIIKLLISTNKIFDINVQDMWSNNALIYACRKNSHKSSVRLLINNGANVNDKNSGGVSPLIRAVKTGRKDITKLLLKSGADVGNVTYRNRSALTFAKKKEFKEILELLKKYAFNSKNI